MSQDRKTYHWLFFFIQPFWAMIYYFKNFRSPPAKNIMWAFTVFFGMTLAVGHESQGSDILDYMRELEKLYPIDLTIQTAIQIYSESQETDIMRILVSLIVSRFTTNGNVLYIVFGLIFGYFFSRNIWYVLNRLQGRLKIMTILFVLILCLAMPIWKMGGFRYNTATHVFIFGLLPYLLEGKKKNLIWCYLTPFLFHYSFFAALLPLTIYLLVGNRLTLYFSLFVFTLFVNGFNVGRFNSFIENNAPQKLVQKTEAYRNQESVLEYRKRDLSQSSVNWYAKYDVVFLRWSMAALLIILYWKSKSFFEEKPQLVRLLNFTFLFGVFANIMSSIPSGGRFYSSETMLIAALIAIYIQNHRNEPNFRWTLNITLPFLLVYCVVALRQGWYMTSVMTLIGNPFIAIFNLGQNTSINDVIKFLI